MFKEVDVLEGVVITAGIPGVGCMVKESGKEEGMRRWVQIKDREPCGDGTPGAGGREVCSPGLAAMHSGVR